MKLLFILPQHRDFSWLFCTFFIHPFSADRSQRKVYGEGDARISQGCSRISVQVKWVDGRCIAIFLLICDQEETASVKCVLK